MIENIRNEAINVDWNNFDSILSFYEKNQLFFDNYELLNDEESIIEIITMKADYIKALISKNRYSKALKIVEHIDCLLKKCEITSEEYDKLKTENLFYSGVLNGYLKNYKLSFEIFSRLVKIDPENDLYRYWLIEMRFDLLSINLRQLSYMVGALIIGVMIIETFFDYDIGFKIFLILFVFFWILHLLPRVLKFLLHSRKLKKQ